MSSSRGKIHIMIALCCGTFISPAHAEVIANTLYMSDAQEVYDGLVTPMWEVDVGIFETPGATLYLTVYKEDFESHDYNLFNLLGSMAAVGAVSRETPWNSDFLVIGFSNRALVYTTEQCRELWRLGESDDMHSARNLILYGSEDMDFSDYLELLDDIGYNH